MVAMMAEEDEDGDDDVQKSIKKKLDFLLRTVASYKLDRIEREGELKEAMTPAGQVASFEQVTQQDAKNEQAPAELIMSAVPKSQQQALLRALRRRSRSSSL